MSFSRLLTHTVSIKRLGAGSGVQQTYSTAATGVSTLIQPLDPESQQAANLAFVNAYKAFMLFGTDVRVGDRLTDQDSRVYAVRGVRNRNYGSLTHIELFLEEDGAN